MGEIEKQMRSKLVQIRQILEATPVGLLCSPGQQVQNGGSINKQGPRHEVGIFSKEVMDPGWLKAALNSRFFNRWVNKSKYTISNDKKKKDSISESTFCVFLIDQFMWNVTSSSEKNQELKEFGVKPLIVVIDDADDSGDATKNKFLKDLIMSEIYIKDLFLFSKLEKECDFMTYLNADDQTDSMPIDKDSLVSIQTMPTQDRHVNAAHTAHMMDQLVSIQTMPTQDRHVNIAHTGHMMGPLVPIQAVANHDRQVNTAPAAHMMGVNIIAPPPATLNPDRLVSSHHAALPAASTNKEEHGNNSTTTHTMGEELLLVAISPTSSHGRFNNSSYPTQIVGKDLLLSIPSIERQKRCAKTSSPANVMDPPVPASTTPNQHTSMHPPDPADMIDKSYSKEPRTNIFLEQAGKKHSIGIFSRSSDEDYSWMVELLTSEYFINSIQDVKPCYISNNGFQKFIEVLSHCTFGILYHTKNRGRVNITNVPDSLYDEELDYLEKMLGKDNVIVVVDDLEDSSDREKTRILENQPDIERLASNLLLISHMEKAEKMQLVGKLKSITQLHHP